MSYDYLNAFSRSQSVAGSAASTNVVPVPDNSGIGEPLCVVIHTETAADSTTGNETYLFSVRTGSSDSLGTVLIEATITAANLTAGAIHTIPLPADLTPNVYLGLHYAFSGTTPTWTGSTYLATMKSVQQRVPGGYPAGVTSI